jgi:hypothetical protein
VTDNKDDGQPATVAAGNDETTVVPPPTEAAPELAWSAAGDDEPLRRPWRTVWGRAAAVVVVCGAAAVTTVLVHRNWARQEDHAIAPNAPVPTSSAVSPVSSPPPVTATLSPSVTAPAPVPPADPVREKNFMAALENAVALTGPNHLSYADIPGSHGAYMGDPTAWLPGGAVVRYGYRACAVLARYPNDHKRATDVFYGGLGFRTDVDVSTEQARTTYMEVVAVDLCAE